MERPPEFDLCAALAAASAGDVDALERAPRAALLAEYHGTRPLHVAVREGRAEAVRWLLARGADPRDVTTRGDSLVTVARDRGHEAVAALLEDGGAGSREDLEERWRARFDALDLALWTGPFWNVRGELDEARRLAGDSPDLVVAAALGLADRVAALLDAGVDVDAARPTGKRALSAAVEFGHAAIARLLLDRGADPNAPEGEMAPAGSALHAAARRGDVDLVDALLAGGADPNAEIDSSGTATYAAATPELRARLVAAGGRLSPYDLVWLGDEEAAVERVRADPASALEGCGTVFAAAITNGRGELVRRLLAAGAELPRDVDECRSYLLEDPALLALLLKRGMDADLPDWQGATLLHECAALDRRGRPRPERMAAAEQLIAAGAALEARDADLASRPVAWAARAGLADLVECLLRHGARPHAADDPEWATPLAWARRRGHDACVALLE